VVVQEQPHTLPLPPDLTVPLPPGDADPGLIPLPPPPGS
jgi:hypothetical protein